jgi:hypothetical protein
VATLFVSRKVEDLGALELVYDAVGPSGAPGPAVIRSGTDPSLWINLHRFLTLVPAHAVVDSNPDLMAAMEKGGVEASGVMTRFYEEA